MTKITKTVVVKEQKFKCNRCKLSEWQGEPLPLELEHKDGNHFNNERDNLEALCPNCHSLTPTWRGRNKNKNQIFVPDSVLLAALDKHTTIRQALLSVGLAGKGGNYKRVYKLKRRNSGL